VNSSDNLYTCFLKETDSESSFFREALTEILKHSRYSHYLVVRDDVKSVLNEMQKEGAFAFVVTAKSLKPLKNKFRTPSHDRHPSIDSYVHLISQCHRLQALAVSTSKRDAVVIPVMGENRVEVLIVLDSCYESLPDNFDQVIQKLADESELPNSVVSIKCLVVRVGGATVDMFDITEERRKRNLINQFLNAFPIPASLAKLVTLEPPVIRLSFGVDKWPAAKKLLQSLPFTVEYDSSLQFVVPFVTLLTKSQDRLQLESVHNNYHTQVRPALQELFSDTVCSVEVHFKPDLSHQFVIEFPRVTVDRSYSRRASVLNSRLFGLSYTISPAATERRHVRSVLL
jgi:hypothetical protein